MNLSDQMYLLIGVAIAAPMTVVATLNWLLRNRGGFARGWASTIFVGLCWAVGITLIVTRILS